MISLRISLSILIWLAATSLASAAEHASVYFGCVSCHGTNGEGNEAKRAPRLAGQHASYLEKQLEQYATGRRGEHQRDANARQMTLIAPLYLGSERRAALAAYIAALPDIPFLARIKGDLGKGQKHYVRCEGCHGKSGQGDPDAVVPRLGGMSDWYLLQRLSLIRDGIHPFEPYNAGMLLSLEGLSDEDLRDLVAYVVSLSGR